MSRPEALCVYCRRSPVDPAWAPFCGERCKMADLGRWLNEDYHVPGEPPGRQPFEIDADRPDGPGGRDEDTGED